VIATQDDLINLGSPGQHITAIHGLGATGISRESLEHKLDAWLGRSLAVVATAIMVLVIGAIMAIEYWLVWQVVFAPWLNLLETTRIR
jgi:hypothetical protein